MSFDPVSLTHTARRYVQVVRDIAIDADGPNAFAAECADATLASLDVLQAALEERAVERAASRVTRARPAKYRGARISQGLSKYAEKGKGTK